MADHVNEEQYEQFEEGLSELPQGKPRYSKLIVATCLVLILAFTITCFVFYWHARSVDPVLISFFFACFGIEFASLAFIRGREIRYVQGNATNKQMGHVAEVEEPDNE